MPRLSCVISLLLLTLIVGNGLAMAQSPPPFNGEDGKEIKVIPSRIILGALPYGGNDHVTLTRKVTVQCLPSLAAITQIDLSQAPGIKILKRDSTPDGVVIVLSIDLQEFVLDQPYGQFIKRFIRLETNSPEKPQFVVPVMGWLAVNETSRDFNRFVFGGSERWQGAWGTPNIAGAILAPVILLLIGGMVWVWTTSIRQTGWLKIGISFLLLMEALALLTLLASTYSRGAWIAFVSGSLTMILFSGPLRRAALASVLFLSIIVFVLPSGLRRVETYSDFQEDLSVANRIKLWTGAFQIMGDHPLTGVGTEQFGDVFERDYQTLGHTAKNSTAVSDYLTFGAEHGLVLLGIAFGALLFLAAVSIRKALLNKNLIQMTFAASFIAILVASAFSTLWFVTDYEWLFGFILSGLLMHLGWRTLKAANAKRRAISFLVRIFAYIGGVSAVLGATALESLWVLPTKSYDLKAEMPEGTILSFHLIEPRWEKAKGIIIYFSVADENAAMLCHSTLRPLSASDWDVVEPSNEVDRNNAASVVEFVHQVFPGKKIFVSGDGDGGKLAWFVDSDEPSGVISAGAGFDFLSEDLNPMLGAKPPRHPFLVFHSLYDDRVSANTAIRAQRHEEFAELPLTVILNPSDVDYFSHCRMRWIEAMNDYFSAK